MNKEESVNALNQIVFENLDVDEVFKELSSCPNEEVSWLCPSLTLLIDVLDNLTKSVYEYDNGDLVYLYNEDQSIRVETIIRNIATDLNSRKDVASAICSKFQKKLPLEVFYLLHKHHVLYLEEYFSRTISSNESQNRFSKAILNLFLSPDTSKSNSQRMASTVMSFLMETNFESGVKPSIRNASSNILDILIKDVIITSINDHSVKQYERLSLLTAAMNIAGTNLAKLSPLAEYILSEIINSNLPEKYTTTNSIRSHQSCLFKQNSMFFNEVIHKIMVILDTKRLIETIEVSLQNESLNWRCALTITSVLLYTHSEGTKLLYGLLDKCLKESLSESNGIKFTRCLIMARHVALQKTPTSLTYEKWFYKYFGDGTTAYVNTPNIFAFLINCLTEMVPHEQAQFLKVHLLKPPKVAPQCRPLLNEYIVLAKTRLRDLKEPFEEMGIFVKASTEEPAEIDVKTALESYEACKKIPSSVIEASVLKKNYFNNRFLKILMKPRVLPDAPDTKVKFIDELKKAGKISQIDYDTYLENCSLEAVKYFSGIESDIDMDVDETSIDPQNEIQTDLEILFTRISDGDTDFFTLITNLSTKLATFLEKLPTSLTPVKKNSYNYADLSQMDAKFNPVIEQIVNYFCRIRQYLEDNPIGIDINSEETTWDSLYVTMLTWHEMLELPLLSYIWSNFLTIQNVVDASKMKGLCLLVYRVQQIYDVRVFESEMERKFHHALFDRVKIHSSEQRNNFLRITSEFLRIYFNDKPDDVNSMENSLLTKFFYVYTCQRRNTIDSEQEDNVSKFFNLDKFQREMKKISFKFEEFLKLECDISIDTSRNPEDRLERIRFLFTVCKIEVEEGLSILFKVLLKEKRPVYFPLTLFLQELSNQLQPMKEGTSWLQSEFLSLFESKPKEQAGQIHLDGQLRSFFALACGLSPHFLFVNYPNENVSEASMVTVKNIIENYMKPYMCESGYLTKKLTVYLHLGIIRRRNAEEVFKFFNTNCPLIISSVIHFWPVMPNCYSDRENQYIETYFNEIRSLFDKETKSTLLPNELIGLILYKTGLRNILQTMENKSFLNEVYQSAVQYMIIEHSLQFTTFKPTVKWPKDYLKFISANPDILNYCKQGVFENGLMCKTFPESIVLVYPLIVSTLMLELHESEFIESSSINFRIASLIILLTNLSTCNNIDDKVKTLPMAEHIVALTNVTSRTVKLLQNIPYMMLTALSKDLIEKCIPPVKLTIIQRIKQQ